MKLNLVFCMNCHAGYIIRNIQRYKHPILNDYNLNHINYARGNYLKTNKLTENDIKLIKNADILVIQYIKNDRGMLNHEFIKKIARTNKIYLLPHYTFGGYFNDNITDKIISQCQTTNQIDNYLTNMKVNKDEILKNLVNCVNYIKELDKLGCCDMFVFVANNYRNIRLFHNRRHPNNIFFIELTNQLLNKIGYTQKLEGIYENISNHANQVCPIYPQIKTILKLEFDCNMYSNDVFITLTQYFSIINYHTCFNKETVEKINSLTKLVKQDNLIKRDFVNLLKKNVLLDILNLIK